MSTIYAVKTTGIFCRPGCKSRAPKPQNVEYFQSPQQARAAGYRACKRCRPEAENDADARFLGVCRAIEQSEEMPTLEQLAQIANMSASHLQRSFKAAIGVSPKAYAQTIKRERLRASLKTTQSATRAIYEAGFSSSSQAYSESGAALGMTPAQFAAGAKGVPVSYAIVASPLGFVLVAATARGVCRVDLDESEVALTRRLHEQFPHAQLNCENGALTSAASLIVGYLSGAGPWPLLPVDVRGTAFQTRVWEALRRLAPGKPISYGELAHLIGSDGSARAVARACAANPVALLIPCHRIVPRGGGAGGYRWEPQRKERLLELERRLSGN